MSTPTTEMRNLPRRIMDNAYQKLSREIRDRIPERKYIVEQSLWMRPTGVTIIAELRDGEQRLDNQVPLICLNHTEGTYDNDTSDPESKRSIPYWTGRALVESRPYEVLEEDRKTSTFAGSGRIPATRRWWRYSFKTIPGKEPVEHPEDHAIACSEFAVSVGSKELFLLDLDYIPPTAYVRDNTVHFVRAQKLVEERWNYQEGSPFAPKGRTPSAIPSPWHHDLDVLTAWTIHGVKDVREKKNVPQLLMREGIDDLTSLCESKGVFRSDDKIIDRTVWCRDTGFTLFISSDRAQGGNDRTHPEPKVLIRRTNKTSSEQEEQGPQRGVLECLRKAASMLEKSGSGISTLSGATRMRHLGLISLDDDIHPGFVFTNGGSGLVLDIDYHMARPQIQAGELYVARDDERYETTENQEVLHLNNTVPAQTGLLIGTQALPAERLFTKESVTQRYNSPNTHWKAPKTPVQDGDTEDACSTEDSLSEISDLRALPEDSEDTVAQEIDSHVPPGFSVRGPINFTSSQGEGSNRRGTNITVGRRVTGPGSTSVIGNAHRGH